LANMKQRPIAEQRSAATCVDVELSSQSNLKHIQRPELMGQLPDCSTRLEIYSTLASHVSFPTDSMRCWAAVSLVSLTAASISRTNSSGVDAIRTTPAYDFTSGNAVETTGKPAAKYSRSLMGLTLSVRRLILNGSMAAVKPFA